MTLANGAIPLLESPEDGARGIEPLQFVIAPDENGRGMAAIRVVLWLRPIVVFGEKESSVRGIGCVFAKESIYRYQESLRLLQSERREGTAPVGCALIPEVRLQISHQES